MKGCNFQLPVLGFPSGWPGVSVPQLEALLERDPLLTQHEGEIRRRYGNYQDFLRAMERTEGGIEEFSLGYTTFGAQVRDDGTIHWTEWAPAASGLNLMGEFNGWSKGSHAFTRKEYG